MRFRKFLFLLKEQLKAFKETIRFYNNTLLILTSLFAFLLMIYDVGFVNTISISTLILNTFNGLFYLFAFVFTLKLLLKSKKELLQPARMYDFLLVTVFVLFSVSTLFKHSFGDTSIFNFLNEEVFSKKLFFYTFILVVFAVEVSKGSLIFLKKQSNPFKVFIFSYSLLILTGAGLLLLPNSTTNGISIVDAIFTSTSAVCVTGLIVVDTAVDFTHTGQVIILLLFQLGGVGFMTFTSFFVLFSDNKFSLQNQIFLKNIVNEKNTGQILKTIIKIIAFTLTFEIIGAVLIYVNIKDSIYFTGISEKVFYSIFHSVSAFCNAGFSTNTDGLYHISTRFNYNMHLVISFLIIIGGLGFPIVFNFYKYAKFQVKNIVRRKFRKENFHHFPRLININSKIVLVTTIVLLAMGFFWFLWIESSQAFEGKSIYGKIVSAFFCSVTTRTAGFNTVDTASLALPSVLMCLLLMWIGASPNSTGGGIKTSAFALGILNIYSVGRGKDRVEINKRRISEESMRNAFAVIVLSIFFIIVSFFLVAMFDTNLSLKDILFECVSAFSTVGLSLGITDALSAQSKIVLIFTMLVGRVGSITIILAFIRKVKSLNYSYPYENVII
jgi:trk system potassium uptake protein